MLLPTQNEKGYTLIIVVLAIVVISILGLGLMRTTGTTLKQSDSERVDQSAYYIAEAGVVQKKKELIELFNAEDLRKKALDDTKALYPKPVDVNKYREELIKHYFELANSRIISIQSSLYSSDTGIYEKQFGKKTLSNVTVNIPTDNSHIYKILSTGVIGNDSDVNKKTRTVTQDLEISVDPKPSTGGNSSNGNNSLFTPVSPLYVKGSYSTPSNKFALYDANGNKVGVAKPNPFPIFPDFPNPNITKITGTTTLSSKNPIQLAQGKSEYYQTLTLSGNSTTKIINTNSTGNTLYVDDLNLSGDILIGGTGKLTIYVKNNINIANAQTSINNGLDATKLTIIYTGNNEVHIKNMFNLYGLLVAPNANLKLTGNAKNDFRITGSVFAGSLFASGGSIKYNATSPANVINPATDETFDDLNVNINPKSEIEK